MIFKPVLAMISAVVVEGNQGFIRVHASALFLRTIFEGLNKYVGVAFSTEEMMEKRQQILTIAKAIEATFSSSEWTEVGLLTATEEYISGHPRLLRSLHWRDDDYKGHVIDAVARMLDTDNDNLKRLLEYEPLVSWLAVTDISGLQALQADAYGMAVPEVIPSGSQAVLAALADAQVLLESRGPTSAVDRVHTGLHGFLQTACTDACIRYEARPRASQSRGSQTD